MARVLNLFDNQLGDEIRMRQNSLEKRMGAVYKSYIEMATAAADAPVHAHGHGLAPTLEKVGPKVRRVATMSSAWALT